MKLYVVLALSLMALGSFAEKAKGRKSFVLPSNSGLRQIDIEELLQNQNGYDIDDEDSLPGNPESALRPDASNGRLFFQKFFLLGKKTPLPPSPQFIIITRPSPLPAATEKPTITQPFTATFDGTATLSTSPVDGRRGEGLEDYVDGEDDLYEDGIANEKPKFKKGHKNSYKIVKGKANHEGLSFLVPSKYVPNFQNNQNSLVMNPTAVYNSGPSKVRKYLLSNNNNNGNGKRKRLRNPVRPSVSQN